MSKACKDCEGRGRWQQVENHMVIGAIGTPIMDTHLVWHDCNSCEGTGVSQDPNDGEDYDIGGSSYANEY